LPESWGWARSSDWARAIFNWGNPPRPSFVHKRLTVDSEASAAVLNSEMDMPMTVSGPAVMMSVTRSSAGEREVRAARSSARTSRAAAGLNPSWSVTVPG